MQAGRVPGRRAILGSMPAEHILVFSPADERGFKAEFGYDDHKGIGACNRGLLWPGYILSTSVCAIVRKAFLR